MLSCILLTLCSPMPNSQPDSSAREISNQEYWMMILCVCVCVCVHTHAHVQTITELYT